MRHKDKTIFERLSDLCFADHYPHRVLVLRSRSVPQREETPWHHHKKAQLVLPLTGVVTSYIDDKMWLVPPRCAVWIPSDVRHSNQISPKADVCMLFIDATDLPLPEVACTLTITPFIRELILHLHGQQRYEESDPTTDRLVEVLIDQLVTLEREEFNFPIPDEPTLNRLALELIARPHEKRTLGEWASDFAMSERTLARMIKRHVQLTFGQWRRQLHIVLALQKLAINMPIQTLSEELGYDSVSAFITFFKKALGKSPRQYRIERWGKE
ncbi:AraC family transcriptional regulator [Marinomonas sp. IMCC 4694]|uniref:AraC family transcriptional regulator n=1 Tax=Marinomonas sp. IMCC 4694 TaxID=2605432 RepID=UPI0021CD13D6|nr:helix-turn-helix transcriptional regulator [Marinomonas sp. IMCC 4694]